MGYLWLKFCRMDRLTMAVLIIIFLQAFPALGEDKQIAGATKDETAKTLTLANCVMLALQNNVAIRNAYLDRISQRMTLRVAEDKFMPQPSLTFSTITTSTYNTDNLYLGFRYIFLILGLISVIGMIVSYLTGVEETRKPKEISP